ncbi:MAG: polysaccharide biosynthesis protein [Lachnospiraceae bacterium]|nr:polysaccharide biosynthesis protein [Lachnospiraceae bacterium]
MSARLKKSLVLQGSILALAGLISKAIGFVYRIPMANIMGNTGNGLYSVSFGIYNIALTLSSYSMPLAVSRLMSMRLAKGDEKNAKRLFKDALLFALCTGLTAALVLFFGAEAFARLYRKEGLEYPLRILAPTVFVVALLGCCRGYFQGHRNMVPTALSQVLEQIVNAIVSVVAASGFVRLATQRGENAPAWGAMGGTTGTLAGAAAALLFFLIIFTLIRKRQPVKKTETETEEHRLLFKAIFFTVLPVILSQSIYQLGYTMDDLIFGNLMAAKGMAQEVATSLQGVFNTQYNQMINLPTAVATAMASATLPSIVVLHTRGEKQAAKLKMDQILKLNMLIALPSAVGLAVLAEPIMGVLFPRLNEYMDTAVMLLRTGSSAVVFYALSTLTTSILQGCDNMRLPVIHSGLSLAIHVVLVAVLVYFTDLGVYALIIGNVTFPLLVSILNCRSVEKLLNMHFLLHKLLIKPLLASLIMGAAAAGVYYLLKGACGMLISMILAMIVAFIVYIPALLSLKLVTAERLKELPLIRKLFRRSRGE